MDKETIEYLIKATHPVFKERGSYVLMFSTTVMEHFMKHFNIYPSTREARIAIAKDGGFVGYYQDPFLGKVKLCIMASWESFSQHFSEEE